MYNTLCLIGYLLVCLGFSMFLYKAYIEIKAIQKLAKFPMCERCEGLSREDLCNKYGDYSAAIAEIEHTVTDYANKDKDYIVNRIKQNLQDLKDALNDN